ncbi:TPA: hypothetical protein N3C02_004440 [Vibrio parahaemolyticus]|nr:hypothetical protein [Vibrio parahaemolyticus]HAS6785134.1 hypothetical protein [Vibrio parahaemolyticus]HAS6793910.1 hypothetical protein [Vibrio parahaemolyticus]HAS6897920.1 hypothetical protein [Vibrio parahaemolyticus]HCM2153293.1 hypothetical protein [Vibrio parahaemolyticus]
MNKLFENEIWKVLSGLAPIALMFFVGIFYEPLTSTVPAKSELILINGKSIEIGNSSATIKTFEGHKEIKYECLCNHGWGTDSFPIGSKISALANPSDSSDKVWELSIGEQLIYSYDEISTEKLEEISAAKNIAIPGVTISFTLTLLLIFQKYCSKGKKNELEQLYELLDCLADTSTEDSIREDYLSKVLSFESEHVVYSLEMIAMNNTNSNDFLLKLGHELGNLWSEMSIEEIEAISFIQLPAKEAALAAIEQKNKGLYKQAKEFRPESAY